MPLLRSCRGRRNSESAPFFNQVANGQVRAENITFAEIADAPAGFLARHAFSGFVGNCAAVWRPLVKDGLQELDVQGKPFMTGLFGKVGHEVG